MILVNQGEWTFVLEKLEKPFSVFVVKGEPLNGEDGNIFKKGLTP